MSDKIILQNKQAKEDLDNLLKDGKITEDYYNKGIIYIAYDYAINGMADDCMLVLMNLSPNFLTSIEVDDNFEKSDFFKKCAFILEILDFTGYTSFDMTATQKEGKA